MFTRRSLLILVLAVGLIGPGCGTDDATGVETFSFGPAEIVLPFIPGVGESQSQVVGLKNLTLFPSTVTVTAYTPAGAAYGPGATAIVVPAQGETRVPLTTFTGPVLLGGWVHVDTTTGPAASFVIAYMDRVRPGGFDDASIGLTWRATGGHVTLSGHAESYEIVNGSKLGAGFVPGSYTVTMYDPFGLPFPPTVVPIGAAGSVRVPVVLGTVGLVKVEPDVGSFPAGTTFRYAVAAREESVAVHNEERFHEPVDTVLSDVTLGFDLEHGVDPELNHCDFGLVLSNFATTRKFLTLSAIYDRNGNQLLPAPRIVGLDPFATKYMSTRPGLSIGLELGELSVLDGLFPDIGIDPPKQDFWMRITFPKEVNVTARQYDPDFFSFYRVVRTRRITPQANVSDLPIQPTIGGGIRNWVDVMNPNPTSQTLFIRGFTPGGFEYILPQTTIPAFSRISWSPDGSIFTEDPFDPLAPPVLFMSFNFSSTGGLMFNARKDVRDQIGLVTQIRPTPVYDLAFK